GERAGWHFDSPFRVGINNVWGSWFAYRVAILTNTNITPSAKQNTVSPCLNCHTRDCIQACPTEALDSSVLSFETCIEYRKLVNSSCQNTCHSRVACPVAVQHRYTQEQLHYHYSVSLKTIKAYY
ncbi:MAG: hypothetical protein R3240_11120, partial [Gammaproteobacteria bacterium]|nr:hypothetical protein [Gammaproteobacteria bacterium]